ncbi:ATP-binding protein [bacterium]|nr:ATP-binding protein [bacterium]
MRISFTGPQCSGKSTLLALCKEYYGDRFRYIEEITRPIARKGFKINEQGDDETQLQILKAHELNSELDDVIMDRCIIDGALYTSYLFKRNKVTGEVLGKAIKKYYRLIGKLDIVFFTEPVRMVDDGVRSTKDEFRQSMTTAFNRQRVGLEQGFCEQFKGNVVYLKGSVENRFEDIKIAIEEYEHAR